VFVDRRDAGQRLARRLERFAAGRPVVVGMPRGGVVVAAEVARALGAPLDIVVVRKLGCPWQPELGIGALAEENVRILNNALIAEAGVTAGQLRGVADRERAELERRVERYRGGRAPLPLDGRTAILIDDGLATGFTARAAAAALRKRGASRVILAVPVAPEDAVASLAGVVDELVAIEVPPYFFGIGEFYDDFHQATDDEVIDLLGARAADG
jgi:putative phosphoribosyl transferase